MTLEQAQRDRVAPWTETFVEKDNYVVFKDAYPVTPGHLLFVPRCDSVENIAICFKDAMDLGEFLVKEGQCTGYNVGINRGLSAGQTVMYPHVHLIPRRDGDSQDPVGGVRGVIPEQANYRSSRYQKPD